MKLKFVELLKHAQFHGAKILIDSKLSLFWTIPLVTLFCAAIAVVVITTERFFGGGGPTFLAQIEQSRESILFPTVIICPEIRYPEEKIEKFLKEIKYPLSLNSSYIRSIIQQLAAFASADVNFNVDDLEDIQDLLDYNDLEIDDASLRLTSSCEEILLKCRWLKTFVNCSSLFRMEMTQFGFCCAFNGRSLKRKMIEDSVHQEPKNVHYVNDVGYTNSLMVAVKQREDLSDIDLEYKWLALCPGNNYVDIMSINGTPLSPGTETWVSYRTRITEVSEDTMNLALHLRRCRLANEPLKFFPVYHEVYCLLECEMKRTLQRCQCLKLAHPSFPDVPLCRAPQLTCSRHATVSFANDECGCPATCNVETEQAIRHVMDLYADSPTFDSFYRGLDLEHISVVRVFVPNHVTRIFERKSYFNTFNLFSQLGGVFNVFFGCSILTLLELMILAWRAARYQYRSYFI